MSRRWALILVTCTTVGCGGRAVRDGCGADGTCSGTEACYASCYCESLERAACARECDTAPGDPFLLEVPEPAPETLALEQAMRHAIDAVRSRGGSCRGGQTLAPVPALDADAELTTAARRHARDMSVRGYFGHESPEGLRAIDRARAAGYRGCAVGENLASGDPVAERVLAAWLASETHCVNLLAADFSVSGIALHGAGSEPVWVLLMGE